MRNKVILKYSDYYYGRCFVYYVRYILKLEPFNRMSNQGILCNFVFPKSSYMYQKFCFDIAMRNLKREILKLFKRKIKNAK